MALEDTKQEAESACIRTQASARNDIRAWDDSKGVVVSDQEGVIGDEASDLVASPSYMKQGDRGEHVKPQASFVSHELFSDVSAPESPAAPDRRPARMTSFDSELDTRFSARSPTGMGAVVESLSHLLWPTHGATPANNDGAPLRARQQFIRSKWSLHGQLSRDSRAGTAGDKREYLDLEKLREERRRIHAGCVCTCVCMRTPVRACVRARKHNAIQQAKRTACGINVR